MFTLPAVAPNTVARLMDKAGQPLAHQAVRLSAGPHTYTAFTDAKGECRFYQIPAGAAKLSVAGEEFALTTGQGLAQPVRLQLTQAA
jgi:hypothetical protein